MNVARSHFFPTGWFGKGASSSYMPKGRGNEEVWTRMCSLDSQVHIQRGRRGERKENGMEAEQRKCEFPRYFLGWIDLEHFPIKATNNNLLGQLSRKPHVYCTVLFHLPEDQTFLSFAPSLRLAPSFLVSSLPDTSLQKNFTAVWAAHRCLSYRYTISFLKLNSQQVQLLYFTPSTFL